ncbi:hypothetical protein F5X99DRAFT_430755 [Biscogniauxia marginata]|nr:hypothetical protein F5X99DRAFT_430755 [Biscogniauxia marginata]
MTPFLEFRPSFNKYHNHLRHPILRLSHDFILCELRCYSLGLSTLLNCFVTMSVEEQALNLVTKDQILGESKKLWQWIHDGESTIRWPPGGMEDLKISSIAVEIIQRFLSATQGADLYTCEVTSQTYLSAVMLYVHEQLSQTTGAKSIAVFCKPQEKYRPSKDTSNLAAGQLSVVYSTAHQMIKLLSSENLSRGNDILALLRQLDGTSSTYNTALDLITMLHKEIGDGLIVMVDKPELLVANDKDDATDQTIRFHRYFQGSDQKTKIWTNSSLVEYTHMLQDLPDNMNTTEDLKALGSYSLYPSLYTESDQNSEFNGGYTFHIVTEFNQSRKKRVGELIISPPLQKPHKINMVLQAEHLLLAREKDVLRANQQAFLKDM